MKKSWGRRPSNTSIPDRVIVFCRYPVPGRTKTRLIPALGRAGAAELQRCMTEEGFSRVRRFSRERKTEVVVCFEGGDEKRMTRWLGPGGSLQRQVSGNLGTRMKAAFDQAFQDGCRRVVLHGTDVPDLETIHLEEAFAALLECDLVLGPSVDGGYWLLGLKGPADLFSTIRWGEPSVLQETLAKAKRASLKVHLLPVLEDLDTPDQLEGFFPGGCGLPPYISVIIPTLNEGENIEPVIRRASCGDAEVIVVDSGSEDDTVPKAKSLGAAIFHGMRGRASQQNLGAKAARGRVVLFLHGDTLLPDSYADHVFEALMDSRVVAGGFGFRTDADGALMRFIEFTTLVRSRYLMLPYGDQALFMRRSVFEGAGGFPECALGEDFHLVRRLSKKGRIATAPASVITSGRRWRERGVIRTTCINQVVVAGLLLGIRAETLARIYGKGGRRKEKQVQGPESKVQSPVQKDRAPY